MRTTRPVSGPNAQFECVAKPQRLWLPDRSRDGKAQSLAAQAEQCEVLFEQLLFDAY